MLKDKNAQAIIAVRDLALARKFYGDTLGLAIADDSMPAALTFRSGETALVVYESAFPGSNRANAVVFQAGEEVDIIARELKAKGVTFEHYDMPGVSLEGDVHVAGDMRMLWFKDPDGNILHVVNA